MLSISSRAEDILIGGASLKTIQDTVVLTESGKIEYKELAQLDPAFVRYLQCLPQPLSTAWGPFCELSHFVQRTDFERAWLVRDGSIAITIMLSCFTLFKLLLLLVLLLLLLSSLRWRRHPCTLHVWSGTTVSKSCLNPRRAGLVHQGTASRFLSQRETAQRRRSSTRSMSTSNGWRALGGWCSSGSRTTTCICSSR